MCFAFFFPHLNFTIFILLCTSGPSWLVARFVFPLFSSYLTACVRCAKWCLRGQSLISLLIFYLFPRVLYLSPSLLGSPSSFLVQDVRHTITHPSPPLLYASVYKILVLSRFQLCNFNW